MSAELAGDDGWRAEAACRGRTRLFFAGDDFSQRVAVAVCRRCAVRRECLADCRSNEAPDLRYGIVAGLTAAQRHAWD